MNTPVPTPSPSSPEVPKQARRLPVAALIAMAAVLIFIIWGFWRAAQPAAPYFQGQMEAREADIAPKVTARISKVYVSEGQIIQPGAGADRRPPQTGQGAARTPRRRQPVSAGPGRLA